MPSPEPSKPDSDSTATITTPDLRRSAYKGRYAIERELGRGGFGVVYLARDLDLHGKAVVVKVLQEHAGESGRWLEKKFQQESEALARIDHPGVVGVIDRGQTPEGKPFLVLDYVEGVALRQVLATAMPLERVSRLIGQLGQALSAAHSKGVFHRDLKPENIILRDLGSGQEQPVIIDFGIATVLDSRVPGNMATQIAGSCHYMAPEQFEGKPEAASDIFALGVIAYEMIARKRPFDGESPVEIYLKEKRGDWAKPTALRAELAPAVDEVIGKALACEITARYHKADEFGVELAKSLAAGRSELAGGPVVDLPTAPLGSRLGNDASEPRALAGGQGGTAAKRSWVLPVAVLAGIVLLAGIVWMKLPPRPSVTVPPASTLSYGLIVQKYQNGRPDGAPFELAHEMLFPANYRLAFRFESAQPGNLYLENEGPDGTWNTLFPSSSANGGSSRVAPGNAVRIPGEGYFRLDTAKGAEKLWILWAGAPAPELEALQRWANPSDKGQIKDSGQIQRLARLVETSARPAVEKDEAGKRTILKGRAGLMAFEIQLNHY